MERESKRKAKEKTKRQQTIISVPLNAQNHLAKPKRRRAGKRQLAAEVGAPHKVLETVFQDLDRRPSWIESNVFALVVCREHNTWMNEYRQQIHYEYMPKAGSKFKARYVLVRSRPRQDEPLR